MLMMYILGGSIHTIKKNAEALVVASKETGLEGNADTTKHMVMSYSRRNFKQIEMRECVLSFGAESFVFQFAIQKFKD